MRAKQSLIKDKAEGFHFVILRCLVSMEVQLQLRSQLTLLDAIACLEGMGYKFISE